MALGSDPIQFHQSVTRMSSSSIIAFFMHLAKLHCLYLTWYIINMHNISIIPLCTGIVQSINDGAGGGVGLPRIGRCGGRGGTRTQSHAIGGPGAKWIILFP